MEIKSTGWRSWLMMHKIVNQKFHMLRLYHNSPAFSTHGSAASAGVHVALQLVVPVYIQNRRRWPRHPWFWQVPLSDHLSTDGLNGTQGEKRRVSILQRLKSLKSRFLTDQSLKILLKRRHYFVFMQLHDNYKLHIVIGNKYNIITKRQQHFFLP